MQSFSVCARYLQGLEPYVNLQSLSLSAVGLTSLEGLPSSTSLRKLVASDNKLSGGLDLLVSCCPNLRKLDLTNNRMATVDTLTPLSALSDLHSLEVEANPLARQPDYRQEIFKIIPSLAILDQQDIHGQGAGKTRSACLFRRPEGCQPCRWGAAETQVDEEEDADEEEEEFDEEEEEQEVRSGTLTPSQAPLLDLSSLTEAQQPAGRGGRR